MGQSRKHTFHTNEIDGLRRVIDKQNKEISKLKTQLQKKNFKYKASLREMSEYYESMIALLPGHVYWMDKNNIFLGCNDLQAKNAGLSSRKEIVGKTNYDMIWKDQAAELNKLNLKVMKTGEPYSAEEYALMANGPGIYLSQKVPLRNKKGKVIGILGISFDITDRKKMEEALIKSKKAAEAADKAKSEFLSNMRHDIRTPLTGIIGFARLIKEEVADIKIAEYSDNVLASSQALLEFLNEILEAIRVNSGEVPLLKKKFDLKIKLQSVITLLQVKAQEKKLLLTLDYDENIPHYLIGDSKRIHRIFLELISNAINFTHQGAIKASATLTKRKKHEAVIKISVADTGVGIPTDKKEEIYMHFNRLTSSYEGIYKGAGLGLTIVKQFIDDLEGEIYVETEPNKGSTFICFIPFKIALVDNEFGIDSIADIKIAPTTLSPDITSLLLLTQKAISISEKAISAHILLVEDQKVAAIVTKEMLQKLDCVVDVVSTGQAAFNQVKKKEYDLILMDIGLPDISGNAVTRQIREWELAFDRHTPILALTAHVETAEKQACIEAGMDAVLSKPLSNKTVINILNAFIPKRTSKKTDIKIKKNKESSRKKLLQITGAVFDLESAAKIYNGNIAVVEEMLQMLRASFPEELVQLKKAHQNEDWETIQAISHKLLGGSSYCGTPRLKAASSYLENYLKAGSTELREKLYQQLLSEIQAVQKQAP